MFHEVNGKQIEILTEEPPYEIYLGQSAVLLDDDERVPELKSGTYERAFAAAKRAGGLIIAMREAVIPQGRAVIFYMKTLSSA